jgi:hypothetical protein
MATLNDMVAKLRGLDLERTLGLRPPYPPVAVEVDRSDAVLVRLKPRRGQKPVLEAHQSRAVPEASVPPSIFQGATGSPEELGGKLSELFVATGTKPGKISVVLPDNLAKVTLLDLPERPASPRHLDELVRSKMRRAVPFRLEEASIAYQVFSGEKRGVTVLVVLTRRSLVERLEKAFELAGARPGLIEICTPNLVNLCRLPLAQACASGADAALLNCARDYFSLVIIRDQRLIFFRCKTLSFDGQSHSIPDGVLVREVANSFAYYADKLGGQGVGTVMVRSISTPVDEIAGKLAELGIESVKRIDPVAWVEPNGTAVDETAGQLLAPAIGAAVGRAM